MILRIACCLQLLLGNVIATECNPGYTFTELYGCAPECIGAYEKEFGNFFKITVFCIQCVGGNFVLKTL